MNVTPFGIAIEEKGLPISQLAPGTKPEGILRDAERLQQAYFNGSRKQPRKQHTINRRLHPECSHYLKDYWKTITDPDYPGFKDKFASAHSLAKDKFLGDQYQLIRWHGFDTRISTGWKSRKAKKQWEHKAWSRQKKLQQDPLVQADGNYPCGANRAHFWEWSCFQREIDYMLYEDFALAFEAPVG